MRRMLVVEDERKIADCLKDYFSARGFEVGSVFSGEEAIERLGKEVADVVLIDVLLPGISGIETLRRVKQMHPKARVVMVTAHDQDHLRQEARKYGAMDYITKPLTFSEPAWSSVLSTPAY